MKRTIVVITLLIVAAGGAYFYFNYWQKNKRMDVRSYVPSGAVWVYESFHTVQNWNDLIAAPLWKNLSTIPFFASLESQVEVIDSVSGRNGSIDQALRDKPFLVSCHLTSQTDFNYIFYFKLEDLNQEAQLADIVYQYRQNENYVSSTRHFAGRAIYEIRHKPSGRIFSYILENNYFAGSFAPFLIEDVIRNLESRANKGFFEKHGFFENVSRIDADQGNLYLDMSRLPLFFNIFDDSEEFTSQVCHSTFLDIKIEDNFLLLNGSSYIRNDSSYYLGAFQNQEASPFSLSPIISNRTATLYHTTLSDPQAWQYALEKYWQTVNRKFYISRAGFKSKYEIQPPEFLDWISGEIGLSIMESVDPADPDRLLYLHAGDLNEGLNRLNRLAETAAEEAGDTVYHEIYGEYRISQITVDALPEMLFGPLFDGFDQTYFTSHENYLILGNSISVLKTLISDIESENVWGKSVRQNLFLENTLYDANFSVFINTAKSWNYLTHSLNEQWKPFFQRFNRQLKGFEQLAIQFNNVDNRFYTNATISINPTQEPDHGEPEQFQITRQAAADAKITSKPFVVKNHIDKTLETVFQDSLNQLYLVSASGEILWKRPLREKIAGELYQIDYFKNGKFQYLFATDHSINILDRNGETIEDYPLLLPDSIDVNTLSLIDYDNSKQYRFLISDEKGRLYMFNKAKECLEGWDPLPLKNKPAYPPEHIRVRGKDYMIAVESSGLVNILTRRGEPYSGFPLELKAPVTSPLFIETGNDARSSRLTAANQNGMIVQFNLAGERIKANQLYKPSKETTFLLCPGALNQTFAIARQDYNRLTILDQQGETLLEKDYVTSGDLAVQYYYFGGDNRIYAVTDKVQEFTYLYNSEGQLINFQPLNSGFEIGLIYSETQNKYHVYSCYGNRFTQYSFSR